jgi:hypothetical protein
VRRDPPFSQPLISVELEMCSDLIRWHSREGRITAARAFVPRRSGTMRQVSLELGTAWPALLDRGNCGRTARSQPSALAATSERQNPEPSEMTRGLPAVRGRGLEPRWLLTASTSTMSRPSKSAGFTDLRGPGRARKGQEGPGRARKGQEGPGRVPFGTTSRMEIGAFRDAA